LFEGSANRKHIQFKADPSVPTMFSASNLDYLGSGWSRGHMSPAGDNKNSQVSGLKLSQKSKFLKLSSEQAYIASRI